RLLKTKWIFVGGDPDVPAATVALERSGVYDEALNQMIRLFVSPNRPLEHSFELSTERDVERVAELLLGVKIPVGKAQLDIESFKHSRSVFRLRLTVAFGAPEPTS